MLRPLILLLLLGIGGLAAADAAGAPPPAAAIDRYVAVFDPDLYALDERGRVMTPMAGAFDAPASDIARAVASGTWFSLLVFLPFLVLPQVLLFWIIFKYRQRGDGRAPATFTGNHRLELVWTAIPCVALVIVGIPMWDLLYRMDKPPADQRRDMVVEVRGKSFSWDYKYQSLGGGSPVVRSDQFEIGVNPVNQRQEPLVLVKDRRVILNLTANDVNHAWWVPAFGVKADTIKGRYTNLWFTPERTGFFKGQCAELCGQGHGIMLISAVVVEAEDFAVWCQLQRHRADADRAWAAFSAEALDERAAAAAVGAYLGKEDTPWRRFALRYWVAGNFAALARKPGAKQAAAAPARRAALDTLIDRYQAPPAAAAN